MTIRKYHGRNFTTSIEIKPRRHPVLQTVIDVAAIAFCCLFACTAGIAVMVSFVILFFMSL